MKQIFSNQMKNMFKIHVSKRQGTLYEGYQFAAINIYTIVKKKPPTKSCKTKTATCKCFSGKEREERVCEEVVF